MLACNRALAGMGEGRRKRRALKNYVANRGKATLIRNDVKTSLRRIIPSLGKFGLSGPRHQALLRRCRKVQHPHLLFPTRKILTSIQIPPFLLLFPLKYCELALFPSICHHELGRK